ncbi:hypothetical protein [Macrococcus brunensis]|uniref:hypothetical protein n=1 Tax=Macrococcus brunensis TaxID=198483 RepID=UPI001EF0EDE0|nr:hypothetical protein [Macrococcus brunensis]ULG71555.1 hypothetical protein MGG12_09640 [Macrococcus brunensis]
MKNILFWLYVVLAVLLIGFGYIYWQSNVSPSHSDSKSNQTEMKKTAFKDKSLQNIYNKNKEMNITLLSTPHQVTDDNQSLAQTLRDHYPSLKINEQMIETASDKIDVDKLKDAKPDVVILDAMTLNDFTEKVPAQAHNKQLSKIVDDLKSDHIEVRVIGTRPSTDKAFKTYQKEEENYFEDSKTYYTQSKKWAKDDLEESYDAKTELLTDQGLDIWYANLTDYLFKK